MDKNTAITVRLPRVLGEKQIQEIQRGLEEAVSGGLGVPHQEVEKWVRSWDTDNELPRPKPTV
jgi:predicted transcriptional regulator